VISILYHAEATAAQITLTWTDNSTNESGFKIERKTGTTGTFAQVATVGANVTSYIDSNLTGGATYCYRVRAYNITQDSGYTNEACATVSPPPPPTTGGLVAAYSFEEGNGATVTDVSGNNNTGSLVN